MLIAHLSDPHLCPPGTLYHRVLDTNARFAEAVAQVQALDPDLVILTGDIAEHGHPSEYALARRILSRLSAPVLAIPGNHDDREGFRSGLAGLMPSTHHGPLHCIREGAVRVIGLDVTVPGQHHGQIDASHAEWLDAVLAMAPDTPTLVMLHQPPFVTGMGFIDTYRCFGEDRLSHVLHRHPQVLRLLCGHVHRFSLATFAGRPAITAPSTATSLALRLTPVAEPASYSEPPAMLIHLWRDGALVSHLQPLGTYPGPHDFF